MSHGYDIVDVDEDESGGLQFKTYLTTDDTTPLTSTSPGPSSAANASSTRRTAAAERGDAPYSPFNLAYYQVYFDVDTQHVLRRVGMAMIPRGGFVQDACDGQVDLYGPFWILTTLILVLYTTSTFSNSITQYLAGTPVVPNIPLLSTATSLVYAYGIGVPALLWAATRYLGMGRASSTDQPSSWGVAEALAVYGYALAVFIPVSLLCLIPYGIVRWALVGLGALSSGFFLTTNVYPVLAESEQKALRFLVVGVGALHLALALAFKVLFYSYSVAGVNGGPDPLEDQMRRAFAL